MTEIDPKLSRLYREASTENPPPALDAAILAAARERVSMPRGRERWQRAGRSSWWSRWVAPASAMATLVLAVSIAFLVEREGPGTSEDMSIPQIAPRRQSPPPTRAAESAKAKAADSATSGGAAKKETPAAAVALPAPSAILSTQGASQPAEAVQATPSQPAAPALPTAEAFPAERRARAATSGTMNESNVPGGPAIGRIEAGAPAAPADAAQPAPMRQRAGERLPEASMDKIPRLIHDGRGEEAAQRKAEAADAGRVKQSNAAGDSAIGGPGAAAPAARAAAAGSAPMRQLANERSPEAWLDEIRRLRVEGREKEAAEQMVEFRKAYPAYAVPEALSK